MRQLKLSLSKNVLEQYLISQVNQFYPDGNQPELKVISHCVTQSLKRIRLCFDAVNLKYYFEGNTSLFNHLYGDHYAAFLYLMSNFAYKEGHENLASKFFLLNKALFGLDAYYRISLPEYFLFVHPLGTVLGNGVYNDFLVVYQGITVGATTDGIYPKFAGKTILYSNASVIGDCYIGENVTFAANSMIVNTNIADSATVLGSYPNHRLAPNKKSLIKEYFAL
jgi:serine O-acetyltransferase